MNELEPNTPYYLYYDGPNAYYVAAMVPPHEDGDPSQSLSYQRAQDSCATQRQQDLTFVGSFVTDPFSQLIPFTRMGDEVILLNSINGIYRDVSTMNPAGTTLTFKGSDLQTKNVDLTWAIVAPNSTSSIVPQSASGVILDTMTTTTGFVPTPYVAFTGSLIYADFPNGSPAAADPLCGLNAQAELKVPYATSLGSADGPIQRIRVLPNMSPNPKNIVSFNMCLWAGYPTSATFQLKLLYKGYVEVPHHLSFY
jgi:hypothetical protein